MAKFFIAFGGIKRHSKAWWSAEVEEGDGERRKAFGALTEVIKIVRLTSLLTEMLRLSSPRLSHGRRLAFVSHPNLSLNLCTLSIVLSLALLPHYPFPLTSPTVPLQESQLRSLPIT